MISALLRKELRQHGGLLAVLALFVLLGLLLVIGNPLLQRMAGSGFVGLKFALYSLVPIGALLLGNALVASEFRHKTQLFLEGLPIPRIWLLVVKYVLVLGTLLSIAFVMLAAAWWSGREGEAMTARFAALLVARTIAWTWCIAAFGFAVGFLGRYRIAALVLVLIIITWLSENDGAGLSRSAPFALLDDRFAFERYVWPVRALALTALWAAALTALGFALGSVRDATVATLLAEKMSSREKIVLTMLLLAGMVAAAMSSESRSGELAVHLPGAVQIERGAAVRVEITATWRNPSDAQTETLARAGARVADKLAGFAEQMDGTLPTVFVVHRTSLAADEFESGSLDHRQGALVRANVLHPSGDPARLEEFVLRQILESRTNGRASMEAWAWVTDGLVAWWLAGHGGDESSALSENTLVAAREAAAKVELSPHSFRTWLRVREQAGRPAADALATVAFHALARRGGADAAWRFARECFGADVPHDVRGWWRDVVDPPERRLRRAAGTSFAELVEAMRQELAPP